MSELEDLERLKGRALAELATIEEPGALEEWRTRYLGRERGELTAVLRNLGKLSAEERKTVGQAANALKTELDTQLAARQAAIKGREMAQALERERIDVTLPGRDVTPGHVHPLSQVVRDVAKIFGEMGFLVVEGPEIETDYYNFQALNIPTDHPARDMQDTFWVVPGQILLRTQTSPNQIRILEQVQPPVRAIVPGKVYRHEAIDATHEAMFHQIEGLMIDEHCTMADLKGILIRFAKEMFGEDRKVRFRPSYFPFTEPSAEVDISCVICNGAGCRVCKYSGWVEILGSGMVDPRVLRGVGYDPAKYRGFAFGMGVERMAMIRYGIDEIRLFTANDLRFLRQFA
ncbi:MAG TPA: phenylalanine--tRNA ligase subunit alpha [Ktedonobacterales bacterium]|jgi:phenylalanyl-tRNA synthetase alpha chain